ncbi:MAG TPA: cobyrinate a,c-diamide synthase [Actinocrinis sp.]|nr:cobyrinate a,c-diamide synthase [Actinocrinis sp.]
MTGAASPGTAAARAVASGGVPRIVVAAPASGHGKTTVATGLVAAFTRRGFRVAPFKVGPDYIDPGYHALAAGRPGRNLDPFLVGEERVRDLFAHGSHGADLAVVEGVMGLYDGAVGRGEFASTAHVAHLIGAPVLLVVDATAQGRSVAALVHGFRSFDPALRLAGVILNQVGSDRHRDILTDALDGIGVQVLGALHRSDAVAAPSRHLGLVPVAERAPDAVAAVAALAGLAAAALDLEAIERIARSAETLPPRAWTPQSAVGEPVVLPSRPVIAVASGAAFTFSYAENAELLAAAGADVAPFDPLRDEKLPDGTAGLVIGGGFPEVYARELSANEPLRDAVRRLAGGGGVIAAECAGLLYLAESLDDAPMCGVLPATARMTGRLTLGYREAAAPGPSALCNAGTRVAGHEFHRTAVTPVGSNTATATGSAPGAAWLWRGASGETVADGFVQGRVHASYLHLHWAGTPSIARRIVEAAACAP